MRVHFIFLVGGMVFSAVAAWFAGRYSGNESVDTRQAYEARLDADNKETPMRPAKKTKRPKVNMRISVAQAIETEVRPLANQQEVERYLTRLKNRAMENKQVTAMEVNPGVEAIMTLEDQLGSEETSHRLMTFTDEMEELSKTFGNSLGQASSPFTQAAATKRLKEIENETDEKALNQAVREYTQRAFEVEDPDREMALMDKLDNALSRNKEATAPTNIDSIGKRIQHSEDNAKKKAVLEYVNVASSLSPEDEMRAMKLLNTLVQE